MPLGCSPADLKGTISSSASESLFVYAGSGLGYLLSRAFAGALLPLV